MQKKKYVSYWEITSCHHTSYNHKNKGHNLFILVIKSKSTTNHLSSFSLSRAITASSRWKWASLLSTLSGLVTTRCGTQHVSCVVPALNYWWTWSTSGRKASFTADATMETVRSHAAEAVMRWKRISQFFVKYFGSFHFPFFKVGSTI